MKNFLRGATRNVWLMRYSGHMRAAQKLYAPMPTTPPSGSSMQTEVSSYWMSRDLARFLPVQIAGGFSKNW